LLLAAVPNPNGQQHLLQPGEEGEIKVTFNSVAKMGLQDKQITVTANTVPRTSNGTLNW
jgi:LEA14-like dessication related protein